MKVEIVPHTIKRKTRWGTVEQQVDLSFVTINGKSAGYVPISGPHQGIFHPLPGFPEQMCPQVVAASNGALRDFLKPQPVHKRDDAPEDTDVFVVGGEDADE